METKTVDSRNEWRILMDERAGEKLPESSFPEQQRIQNPKSRFDGMTLDEALDIIDSDVARLELSTGVKFEPTRI